MKVKLFGKEFLVKAGRYPGDAGEVYLRVAPRRWLKIFPISGRTQIFEERGCRLVLVHESPALPTPFLASFAEREARKVLEEAKKGS